MAWKIPLADQMTSDRAKLWMVRMNATFISPLPTRPRPTRRRAPIRSARTPTGSADSEYTQKNPAARAPMRVASSLCSSPSPGTATEKLTLPR